MAQLSISFLLVGHLLKETIISKSFYFKYHFFSLKITNFKGTAFQAVSVRATRLIKAWLKNYSLKAILTLNFSVGNLSFSL